MAPRPDILADVSSACEHGRSMSAHPSRWLLSLTALAPAACGATNLIVDTRAVPRDVVWLALRVTTMDPSRRLSTGFERLSPGEALRLSGLEPAILDGAAQVELFGFTDDAFAQLHPPEDPAVVASAPIEEPGEDAV